MKRQNRQRALVATLSIVGLACATVAACGGSNQPQSFVNAGGAANGAGDTTGQGGDGSGIDLNVGGHADASPSGGNGVGEGGSCGATRFVANPPVINVLLVVDKSLSMNDKPTGFNADKWTALQDALSATFGQTKSKISYGLDLFPYSGKTGQMLADTCQMPTGDAVVVPVQAGTKTAPLILSALAANPPSGGTPTSVALSRAVAYFTTGAGQALTGEKYVLLATDGGPNCNTKLTCAAATCTVNMDGKCPANTNCCDAKLDPLGPQSCLDQDAAVAGVAALQKAGVKTIVVGIPGTEAYTATLDALAAKSGVTNPDAPPSYFAVSAKSGVAGLSTALETITTGLVKSCELHVEQEPPDRRLLYVVIDGVEIKRDDPNGWTIPDASVSPPVIEITGTTCKKLETDGAQYINVTYGCPQYEPPVK